MKKLKAWILLKTANFGLFIMDCKPDYESYSDSDLIDILKLKELRRHALNDLEKE